MLWILPKIMNYGDTLLNSITFSISGIKLCVPVIPGIIISYLIGSVPTAYIFVRVLKGKDIRAIGSGNVGATNASRVLGRGWGVAVLALDVLKGFASVMVLSALLRDKISGISFEMLQLMIGAACIAGHVWTAFLGFRGGKGVATTLGVLIALSVASASMRPVLGSALLTWALVFAASRIVSLASIVACVSFPIYMAIFRQSAPLVITTTLLAVFIVIRHRDNLIRIFRKKEHRLF